MAQSPESAYSDAAPPHLAPLPVDEEGPQAAPGGGRRGAASDAAAVAPLQQQQQPRRALGGLFRPVFALPAAKATKAAAAPAAATGRRPGREAAAAAPAAAPAAAKGQAAAEAAAPAPVSPAAEAAPLAPARDPLQEELRAQHAAWEEQAAQLQAWQREQQQRWAPGGSEGRPADSDEVSSVSRFGTASRAADRAGTFNSSIASNTMGGTLKGLLGGRGKKKKEQIQLDALRCGAPPGRGGGLAVRTCLFCLLWGLSQPLR